MKKFLIVLVILFIANLGCKKMSDNGGGGLCACSPTVGPSISLVIKNNAGIDLLDPKNAGAYAQGQIQLFSKDVNGAVKPISFAIRSPFSYGSEKFDYSLLYSEELVALAAQTANNSFYLKLGENEYELNLQINMTSRRIEKLLIDKKDAPRENGTVASYINSIFYFNL